MSKYHLARHRRIDDGGILRKLKDSEGAIPVLQDGLGRATSAGDTVLQFHAHYHLWKVFEAKGDATRASFGLHAAQFHVRFIDETASKAVRAGARS